MIFGVIPVVSTGAKKGVFVDKGQDDDPKQSSAKMKFFADINRGFLKLAANPTATSDQTFVGHYILKVEWQQNRVTTW